MQHRLSSEGKSSNLHLRIEPRQKALIDQAALALGKNRSAFMIEAAYTAAEEVLFDQTHFHLSSEQWIKFNEALNTPPRSNKLLKKLLETKSPWEKE